MNLFNFILKSASIYLKLNTWLHIKNFSGKRNNGTGYNSTH